MNALVPLYSNNRFQFSFSGGSCVVFDTVHCRFIFPEWISLTGGWITKEEVTAQSERDFEEVRRITRSYESLLESYLRAFAKGWGIPYGLMNHKAIFNTVPWAEYGKKAVTA